MPKRNRIGPKLGVGWRGAPTKSGMAGDYVVTISFSIPKSLLDRMDRGRGVYQSRSELIVEIIAEYYRECDREAAKKKAKETPTHPEFKSNAELADYAKAHPDEYAVPYPEELEPNPDYERWWVDTIPLDQKLRLTLYEKIESRMIEGDIADGKATDYDKRRFERLKRKAAGLPLLTDDEVAANAQEREKRRDQSQKV